MKTFSITLFLLFSLTGCENLSEVDKRLNTISKIRWDAQRLEKFSIFLQERIDTNFHVQYRSKDYSYHFFYFRDGTIAGSFTPSTEVVETVAQECDHYQFRDIWKYDDENFYRFRIQDPGKAMGLVLVLKKGEGSFKFSPDSNIGNVEKTDNIDEISKKFPNRRLTFAVSKSILIYFKEP
jgi:hypothetical protein